MMGDGVKQMLVKPIQLADQVTKGADSAQSCRRECAELKSKAERLAALLRQAARAAELYERPAGRIVEVTKQVLEKALFLVSRCRPHGHKPVSTAFNTMSTQLDNSLADVSWLLRASAAGAGADAHGDDGGAQHLGLPPIAQNEPYLFLIWGHIATLHTGSLDARSDSADKLASLASGNGRYGKLIIEEEGVGPLLRLVRDGRVEGQENAARALGLLGRDPKSVEPILHAGVCSAFAKVLKEGPMRAQAMAAWAIAELVAAGQPKCQDLFAQNNVVRLLVGHLTFETVQEHSKYSIIPSSKPISIQQSPQTHKRRESEDSANKAHLKAMAARALWQLAKGNPAICKSITESGALLCFAVLLEKGPGEEVQRNSAMALMEICRVAEHHAELQRSAFRPNSPAAKAVIDQLIRVVEVADHNRDDELLLPCVTSLGCLSRSFRSTERRVIAPLVRLLDEKEGPIISREATVALTKFARTEYYLHIDNSRAIIEAGGVEHLVQLAYLGKQQVQIEALVLLCYISLHVPDGQVLAQAGVLAVLAWASTKGHMVQDPRLDSLLPKAKSKLVLFQSRGSAGFH